MLAVGLILLPIEVEVLCFRTLIERDPSKPLTYEHEKKGRRNSMAYCPMHDREDLGLCPECVKCYNQEVAEGHIPPAFTEAGVEFSFNDWHQIRLEEYALARQRVDPDLGRTEAEKKKLQERVDQQLAQDKQTIARLAASLAADHQKAPVTPGQRQKQLNDKVRSYRTY